MPEDGFFLFRGFLFRFPKGKIEELKLPHFLLLDLKVYSFFFPTGKLFFKV
jgi:hypothetical protein